MGVSCSCIKGNFDLSIGYNGCSTLLIEDMSDWMVEGQIYSKPESYSLEILTPNRPKSHTVTILTDKRNRVSPEDVGINGSIFNDGIYCFKTESCGIKYQRNKLLSCQTECCISDAVARLKNKEDVILLDEIRLMLDSCRVNTEIGNLTKANDQFKMVSKLLKNLNCNCK